MASRTAIVSTTIHDVIQIFQGLDENDCFQTVLDNEELFTLICNAVLRPIYRCATQSKCPQHNRNPPRTRIIQEIAAQEGIPHGLPSTLEHTATSENSLSSQQSAVQELLSTPECVTIFEHDQSLESSTPCARSAIREPPSTPEYLSNPDIHLSSGRNATAERFETPGLTFISESNSVSDDASCAEHSHLLRDSTPDSAIKLSDTCLPPSSRQVEGPVTIEELDSGIDLSDEEVLPSSTRTKSSAAVEEPGSVILSDNTTPRAESSAAADEDVTLSKSPQAETSTAINEPDNGIDLPDNTTPRAESSATANEDLTKSSQAQTSATNEEQDSGIDLSDNIADEDRTLLNSPQADEVSATTEQDQISPGDQPILENQTESLYANRLGTIKISLKFDSWIRNPKKEFWEHSITTTGLEKEADVSTRLKIFVQDALTKKGDAELQKLRYRFTSILVYQSFQKMMETDSICSKRTQEFLKRMDIPLESEQDCSLLLHGGKNRVNFNKQISPGRDEIDHGPQCLPDLNDNIWDFIRSSHFQKKAKMTADKLRSQNITSWSETSGAQLAAKNILLYGQELLDLQEIQYKHDRVKGEKRKPVVCDQTPYVNKRIRTDFQNSQPNVREIATTPYQTSPYIHTSPINCQPDANKNANQSIMRVNAPTPSAVSSNICLPELDQNSHNAEIDIHAYSNDFGNTGLHSSINPDVSNFVPNPDRGATERSGDEQTITRWDGGGPPGQQPLFLEEVSLDTISEWNGGEALLYANLDWNGGEEFDTTTHWMHLLLWDEGAISRGFL